jgi:hypothetical protein
MRKRGLTKGHLTQTQTSRREDLVAALEGRYRNIIGGRLRPVDQDQAIRDAFILREKFKLDKTLGHLRTLSRVIMSVDKKAAKANPWWEVV